MTNSSGGAVELARNFAQEKGYTKVTSTLIYGIQWDCTMQFMDNKYLSGECDENSYVRNSTEKGNYSGSLINTGSNDNYKIKNIYDMAGNAWEWTMESWIGGGRVGRGVLVSHNGSVSPASNRDADIPIRVNSNIGLRVALYIK